VFEQEATEITERRSLRLLAYLCFLCSLLFRLPSDGITNAEFGTALEASVPLSNDIMPEEI
jgi:hypothetical protein